MDTYLMAIDGRKGCDGLGHHRKGDSGSVLLGDCGKVGYTLGDPPRGSVVDDPPVPDTAEFGMGDDYHLHVITGPYGA